MSDILQYHMRPAGLGILIIELSVLLASNKIIHAFVPAEYDCQSHMLYDFKRIFKIGDDRLTIISKNDEVNDPASDDLMKTFVPYFTSDSVNLFGKEYPVGARNKPCIGLAMHHAGGNIGNDNYDPLGENRTVKDFPHNKFATYDTYSRIIKLVTDAGYDVITFNSHRINIENKIFQMNNLCDCIIGYEGGAIQLAHTLKIPSIVLPWNAWYDGDTYWKDGTPWDRDRIQSHKYHIDRRTYFLKSQEEIVGWDRNKLRSVIDQLYQELGNNVFFGKNIVLDKQSLTIDSFSERNMLPELSELTKAFICQHIANPQIG